MLRTVGSPWPAGSPALFDWCEENYRYSSQLAEFHNSWTNLAYVAVGLATAIQLRHHPGFGRLRICGLALIGIGLGSIGFHGTLTRVGQAADELAIVYWEVALLFTVFEKQLASRPWLPKYLVGLLAAETGLYMLMDSFPRVGWALYHPLHVSVAFVTVVGLYAQLEGCQRSMAWIKLGLGLIGLAFGCWLLDMFACEATGHLYLHAFGWHLFSAAAILVLHAMLAMQVCRQHRITGATLLGISLANKP